MAKGKVAMLSMGNKELAEAPSLGDTVTCPHCHQEHTVEQSSPSGLQFYKCGDTRYLAGIDGKSIMDTGGKDED